MSALIKRLGWAWTWASPLPLPLPNRPPPVRAWGLGVGDARCGVLGVDLYPGSNQWCGGGPQTGMAVWLGSLGYRGVA